MVGIKEHAAVRIGNDPFNGRGVAGGTIPVGVFSSGLSPLPAT